MTNKIKKGLLATVLMLPLVANAGWKCTAYSPSATGWGISSSLSNAKAIALNECSKRTPYYQACYISDCWWVIL